MSIPTVEDFKWSKDKIVEAVTTWNNFNGFTGETCCSCKKKVNVLACGPGWICVCGEFNAQSFHGANIPHDDPDLGPTQTELLEAYAEAKRWRKE